ncbi:hypothetical protein HOLleu_21691 [Holothuria leucospilota]|uniref:Ig-like domain-containing protein n=1 Tax=Holothuria leucospilota TaxID=206669 RepID=A0A9Q1BWR1_HOLLE|nr:hypothetical protein HOLleu_21691 [Holothuria leucospilota]
MKNFFRSLSYVIKLYTQSCKDVGERIHRKGQHLKQSKMDCPHTMTQGLLILIVSSLQVVSSSLNVSICDQRHTFRDVIICNVPLHTNVCLVCPVSRGKSSSSWELPEGKVLFREEVKVDRGISLAVNNCGTSNYTLLLTSVQNKNQYVCQLHKETIANFSVHVEGLCDSTRSDLTYCQVRLQSEVCLVCPVSRNLTDIKWEYSENKTLFRGIVNTNFLPNILTVNNCSLYNYTLSISNLTEEAAGRYSCYHHDDKIADFVVQTKDKPNVEIHWNEHSTKYLAFKEGADVALTCVAKSFDLPLALSWEINGNEIYTEPITYSSTPEIRRDRSFKVTMTSQNISCIIRSFSFTKLASLLLSSDSVGERKSATSLLFVITVSIGILALPYLLLSSYSKPKKTQRRSNVIVSRPLRY